MAALDRDDVGLVVCGSGEPPPQLRTLVARFPWCTIEAGLSDAALASQLAAADLFVLAARTRPGRRAGTPVVGPPLPRRPCRGRHRGAAAGESAAALATVLADLVSDPALLARMGTPRRRARDDPAAVAA